MHCIWLRFSPNPILIVTEAMMSNVVNPLPAIIYRENINIYLLFMSFLHTNKAQVTEIPLRVRQEPAVST